MTDNPDRESDVRRLCLACVPPALLSNPNGWRLTNDDEYSEAKAREASQRQVERNAEVIVEWVLQEAPRCLTALLHRLRHDLGGKSGCVTSYSPSLVAFIVVTAARFVSPREQAVTAYDIVTWSESERSLWTTSENVNLAHEILEIVCKDSKQVPIEVVDAIFRAYLRPLFSNSSSANMNKETGRARKQQESRHTSQSMEEDIMWKGGDVLRARKTRVFDHEMAFDFDHGIVGTRQRHAGLGCDGVLFVCCRSLKHAKIDDVWTQHWPNVIPPLLQMLEDPSPRYRLAASGILAETILNMPNDTRAARQLSSLLRRTGMSTLLLQNLEASLTFISHRLAGPLLQSTSEAYVRLVSVTSETSNDDGRAKYEQLSRLMDQGVLRVWAYAPSASGGQDLVEGEVRDVIEASFIVLAKLAHKDNLGVGIVRYLDITLEYLTQQLFTTEAKVTRYLVKKDVKAELSLVRELRVIRAMHAVLEASKDCPSLETWVSRCVTSLCRSWTVLQRAKISSKARTVFDAEIRDILRLLHTNATASTDSCIGRLRELDGDFFAPLIDDLV